jgi:hypothetical protein
MDVAPIRVKASAKATLRIAFTGLVAPIAVIAFVLRGRLDAANTRCRERRGSTSAPLLSAKPM